MTTISPKSPAVFTASMLLALAPAAALAFLWPSATAQTPAKVAYAHVSIENIMAQDADAISAAHLRIKAAARSVCAEVAIRSPLNPREQSDCERDAVTNAMAQLVAKSQGIAIASAD